MDKIKKIRIVLLGVVIFYCVPQATFSQSSNKVYKDMDGNKLSVAEVDSLKKVYGSKLRIMEYTNEQGLVTNFVRIPKKRNEKKKDDEAAIRYYDKNGLMIDKETFNSYTNEGYHFSYKVEGNLTSLTLNAEKGDSNDDLGEKLKNRLLDTKYPDYTYSSISGNNLTVQSFLGKVVVLNFWFIGCRPCINEMPILNNLVDEFKDQDDVVFIAPALDGQASLKSFLKENIFKYQIAFDAHLNNEKMGIGIYPTHIIIDRNGIIKYVSIGAHEDIGSILKENIQNFVNE